MRQALIDGRVAGTIDLDDRGLHYGDGCFTTIACEAGEALLWSRHRARLDWACAVLGLADPDWERLAAEVAQLSTGVRAVVKVMLTRASGRRGYAPSSGPTRRIVLRYDWPELPTGYWHHGIGVRTCRLRLGQQPRLAGIKHLNRLEQVLARAEWQANDDCSEGLLLDEAGHCIGATMSNVFIVSQGRLATPWLGRAGIAGVMRGLVIDLAQGLGMPCHVGPLPLEAIREADEIMLSNALIGLWPVRRLDGEPRPVGPVATILLDALWQGGHVPRPEDG